MDGGDPMTFTYQPTLATDRDWIRFRMGDTSSGAQRLSDEEIDGILSDFGGNKYRAAIACSHAIGAIFGTEVDKTVGRFQIKASQKASYYSEKLPMLLEAEMGTQAVPYAGGISEADKLEREQDSDRVKPSFTIGMDDFPENSLDPPPGETIC